MARRRRSADLNAVTQSSRPPSKRQKVADSNLKFEVQRVIAKKKKTSYLETTDKTAPDGYTYLPVGFKNVKEFCRDESVRQGRTYYVVTNKRKGPSQSNIYTLQQFNQLNDRLGWHFPSDIIMTALSHFGLVTNELIHSSRNPLAAQEQEQFSQVPITDENLREIILDLFPKIPESNLRSCIKHAFKKGTDRIGNASDLSFTRRVQLAVLAHIRHTLTDYDEQLRKKVPWAYARANIERQCFAIILKWRGEDDEYELEERTEEVIVIDDDSDEEALQAEREAEFDGLDSRDRTFRAVPLPFEQRPAGFNYQAAGHHFAPQLGNVRVMPSEPAAPIYPSSFLHSYNRETGSYPDMYRGAHAAHYRTPLHDRYVPVTVVGPEPPLFHTLRESAAQYASPIRGASSARHIYGPIPPGRWGPEIPQRSSGYHPGYSLHANHADSGAYSRETQRIPSPPLLRRRELQNNGRDSPVYVTGRVTEINDDSSQPNSPRPSVRSHRRVFSDSTSVAPSPLRKETKAPGNRTSQPLKRVYDKEGRAFEYDPTTGDLIEVLSDTDDDDDDDDYHGLPRGKKHKQQGKAPKASQQRTPGDTSSSQSASKANLRTTKGQHYNGTTGRTTPIQTRSKRRSRHTKPERQEDQEWLGSSIQTSIDLTGNSPARVRHPPRSDDRLVPIFAGPFIDLTEDDDAP